MDISFKTIIFEVIRNVDCRGVFRHFQKITIFEVILDAFCRGVSGIFIKIQYFANACEHRETRKTSNFYTKITRFWKAFAKSVGALVYFFKKNMNFVLILKGEC